MSSPLKDRLAHLLVGLYPRAWRDRYGQEFLALLEAQPLRFHQGADIVCGALREWAHSAAEAALSRLSPKTALATARLGRSLLGRFVLVYGLALLWVVVTNAVRFDSFSDAEIRWTPALLLAAATAMAKVGFATWLLERLVFEGVTWRKPPLTGRESFWLSLIAVLTITLMADHPMPTAWTADIALVRVALGGYAVNLWVCAAAFGEIRELSRFKHSRPVDLAGQA